jgi:NAD(P)-dependent dehydrogenase (short-subunit alcohol dehydrogenase family)
VALCDVDAAAGGQTEADIRGAGGVALFEVADVADAEAVARFVDRTVRALGPIDVLVNNAGIDGGGKAFVDVTEAEWQRVLDVNLNGCFHCCKYVVPHMLRAGHGVVINLSSVMAVATLPRAAAYTTSKAALVGLTKALALELGPHGIRVNCLLPGSTDTGMMWIGLSPQERLEIEPEVAAQQPLARIAQPDEIARVALFLASDEASFVTGAAVVVDGGLLTRIAAVR